MIDGMTLPEAARHIMDFAGPLYMRAYTCEIWAMKQISDGEAVALLYNMGFRGRDLDPSWRQHDASYHRTLGPSHGQARAA